MASALDGIVVLDLTQGPAGAMATMYLCDSGARVIRIDTAESLRTRQRPGYLAWDRGKESVVLDLAPAKGAGGDNRHRRTSRPAGLSAFHRLAERADVLVESFPPDSPYQSIVSYDRLVSTNPRLVHCSITAYGHRGPLAGEPPMDDLVMARTGILASQPSYRPGPIHVVHSVPSVGAGLLAAQGIVAALYAREKTGRGRQVETSLMAGALLFAPKVAADKLKPNPFKAVPAGGGPFYSVFECADGNWIQLGCIHAGFVDLAAAVMDMVEVMTDPRYGDGRVPQSEEARAELFDIVAGVIKTRPYHQWAEIFEGADVPYARACTTEEAMDNLQVRANQMAVELVDPHVGPVVQMGLPIKLSATPGHIKGPRALPGQDTAKVLSELADSQPTRHGQPLAPQPPAQKETLDPPLAGVRVLELTNVIAGPTAGKLLAELGADVVKLEGLDGDLSRPSGRAYFLYLNSDKRSVSVNTRTPEGKEIAQKLAAGADILLANMRPGATDRMGIGPDVLKSLSPRLIETHVTAYGWTGPYAHRPGVDPLAQALMGLQRAQGGRENPPVFLSALAPTDFAGGALGALGAVMALFARERTGLSQRVDTNLLNGGIVVSSEAFMSYRGKPPRRLVDKGLHGLDALHRLYQTGDGWIYLVAETQEEWLALCGAIGRGGLADDERFASAAARCEHDALLALELTRAFGGGGSEAWIGRLREVGVPCAPAVAGYSDGFFSDPQAEAGSMVAHHQHPTLGWMTLSRNSIRFGDTSPILARPTPLLGQHTREVLQELGYSQSSIEELHRKGVVKTESAEGS